MKGTHAVLIVSALLGSLLLFGNAVKKNVPSLPVVHADGQKGCSTRSVGGTWAFTDTGTVIDIGPRAAVGSFTLDGEGNLLNGLATSSLNGSIAGETFSGTYTVSSNCAGTINVNIFDASTGAEIFSVILNIQFDDNEKELRGLFTSVVTPNGTPLSSVISLAGRKL